MQQPAVQAVDIPVIQPTVHPADTSVLQQTVHPMRQRTVNAVDTSVQEASVQDAANQNAFLHLADSLRLQPIHSAVPVTAPENRMDEFHDLSANDTLVKQPAEVAVVPSIEKPISVTFRFAASAATIYCCPSGGWMYSWTDCWTPLPTSQLGICKLNNHLPLNPLPVICYFQKKRSPIMNHIWIIWWMKRQISDLFVGVFLL